MKLQQIRNKIGKKVAPPYPLYRHCRYKCFLPSYFLFYIISSYFQCLSRLRRKIASFIRFIRGSQPGPTRFGPNVGNQNRRTFARPLRNVAAFSSRSYLTEISVVFAVIIKPTAAFGRRRTQLSNFEGTSQ